MKNYTPHKQKRDKCFNKKVSFVFHPNKKGHALVKTVIFSERTTDMQREKLLYTVGQESSQTENKIEFLCQKQKIRQYFILSAHKYSQHIGVLSQTATNSVGILEAEKFSSNKKISRYKRKCIKLQFTKSANSCATNIFLSYSIFHFFE